MLVKAKNLVSISAQYASVKYFRSKNNGVYAPRISYEDTRLGSMTMDYEIALWTRIDDLEVSSVMQAKRGARPTTTITSSSLLLLIYAILFETKINIKQH